jgi:hypothetical protein
VQPSRYRPRIFARAMLGAEARGGTARYSVWLKSTGTDTGTGTGTWFESWVEEDDDLQSSDSFPPPYCQISSFIIGTTSLSSHFINFPFLLVDPNLYACLGILPYLPCPTLPFSPLHNSSHPHVIPTNEQAIREFFAFASKPPDAHRRIPRL